VTAEEQEAETRFERAGIQAGRVARLERNSGLALAVSQAGQRERERERERRVSDADASYYGPISDTRTLEHVIPQ
jgi:hypothetical protein